jgi:hypothetical protein
MRTKALLAILILSVSFVVKSLHSVDLAKLIYTTDQPFNGLTETYDARAVSILNGEGILGPYDIDPSNTQWLTQAPGYSIFLCVVYRVFGRDFFKVQLVQNLINSFSPVLIFAISGSLLGWRVGFASGLLSAISHHMGHISNFILPDEMNALPVLAGVYLLVIASNRVANSYWLYAGAGVAIGVSSWLRAQTMLLGVFVLLVLAITSNKRIDAIRRGIVMATVSVLVIAPITVRNYSVYGEFIPIQLGTGLNLWEGIGDASADRFGAVRLDTEVATQEAELYNDPRYAGSWTTPDGIKRDRDRTKRSLDIIRQHPVWYAGVMLGRCGRMLKYSADAPLVFGSQSSDVEDSRPIKRGWKQLATESSGPIAGGFGWLRPLVRALQRAAKETLLLFIILGVIVLFIASRRRMLMISIVPLYYFFFQSALHTEFRYTLPMQFFVFVFAASVWVIIASSVYTASRALLLSLRSST